MLEGYSRGDYSSKHAAAFYAAYFGVLGVLLPYLGPYLQLKGIGPVGIGLITAAVSLAKVGYTPFVGAAVDRGRWFSGLLTVHVALAAAIAFALHRVRGSVEVGVAFFIVGLGYATVLPLVEATILEKMPARGYGGVRVWGSVGFILVATAAGPAFVGKNLLYFPTALGGLLVVLAVSCLPFDHPPRPRTSSDRGGLPAKVWWLLLILFLHQVSHGPYYAFFSIDLKAHGMSNWVVSAMWSIAVIAESLAFLKGSWLERRLGLRRLLGVALFLTPFRWLLLALPPTLPILLLAQLGHAVTFALAHLAGVQLVQRAAPAGTARRAQALYSGLTFGLGIVLGSAAAGPLYAAAAGPGSFLAATALSTALFLVWLPLGPRLGLGLVRK